MGKLKNQIVFITGASSGIGESCARAFAQEGVRLLIAARRLDRLNDLKPKLLELGAADVHAFSLDVQDRNAVEQSLNALPAEWSAIDILINNAGLSRGLDKLYEAKVQDWEEMIDTNVKGVLYVSRAILPGMLERGRGHVVNLGSTAGEIPYPGGSVYCASKAALKFINDGLRQDLLGTPIRVSSVDPGMVQTEFAAVRFRGDDARAAKVYQGVTPLTPDDIADAILWSVTRPAHVNINHIMMTTIDQANSLLFNRKPQ